MIEPVLREAYPTISEKEWEAMYEAAVEAVAAMPPLTSDQIATVCELFPPITPQDLPPKAASHAQNPDHQTRRSARRTR